MTLCSAFLKHYFEMSLFVFLRVTATKILLYCNYCIIRIQYSIVLILFIYYNTDFKLIYYALRLFDKTLNIRLSRIKKINTLEQKGLRVQCHLLLCD